MKFSIRRNKDSSLAFERALLEAGHQPVARPEEADFLLFDSENVGRRRDELSVLLARRPGFIYPHTPQTCWIWDGVYQPLPVACNFVYAEGPKAAMELYGYPCRVEVVGFPRCEILPFRPARGTKLLYIPARPRKDGGRHEALDRNVLEFILKHRERFESVTVCITQPQFPELEDGHRGIRVIRTDPKGTPTPAQDMVRRIDQADVIISTNTPGVLSVARGKPTIFYGEHEIPDTITGAKPKSYEKYRHLLQFPLTLEDMTIEEVLFTRLQLDERVEKWRTLNVGEPFNARKFIRMIEGCLIK